MIFAQASSNSRMERVFEFDIRIKKSKRLKFVHVQA